MANYFLRRLLWAIGIVFVIIIINFLLIQAVPGDPIQGLLGEYPAPPDYIARMREEFGLDQPVWVQLWKYMSSLATGNLGYSFASRQAVLPLILERSVNTLYLMIPALVLSLIVGLALALASASRAGRWLDATITGLTLFGYSIPIFWLGQVLVLVFSIQLGWLPSGGMNSLRTPPTGLGVLTDTMWHMALPLVCIMVFKVAVFARTGRASILNSIDSDFVVTAKAKGLGEGFVMRRHVLPNAIIPVIAVFGYQFGHALTSSLLVETVFSWPGLGSLFVNAIDRRDFPVLQGILLLSAILVVIANILADVCYMIADPRIRRSMETKRA